jgi:hypothetical protein
MAKKRHRSENGDASDEHSNKKQLKHVKRLLKDSRQKLAGVEESLSELEALVLAPAADAKPAAASVPPQVTQLLQLCMDNDLYEPMGKLMLEWDQGTVQHIVQDWSATTFALVCVAWPPEFSSGLLGSKSATWISRACESMTVKEISRLLPVLSKKAARQVLGKLYFTAADPYLSRAQCKRVLLGFPPEQQARLVRKFGRTAELVMQAEADSDGGGEEGAGSNPESYESSFIDDEEGAGDSDYSPSGSD